MALSNKELADRAEQCAKDAERMARGGYWIEAEQYALKSQYWADQITGRGSNKTVVRAQRSSDRAREAALLEGGQHHGT